MAIVERDLRRRISPDLTSAGSKLQVDYMIRLLQWVSSHVGRHDALDAKYQTELRSLLAMHDVERNPTAGRHDESLEATINQLRLIAAASPAHPALFEQYVELETALVQASDAKGGTGLGDVYLGGKLAGSVETAPPACDEATLSAYLKRRHGTSCAAATEVAPLPGGFGKDTILFTMSGCGSLDGEAVIRKDFSVRPGPRAVTTEFPLLRALQVLRFPVAEPLWAEPDETILGGPFIVSRRVAGTSAASEWGDSVNLRRHFVDHFANLLARLHSITARELYGTDDLDMRTGLEDNIKLFYDHYKSRARAANGRIEAGFAWLLANLSVTDDTSARLVHGDVGFHNILMADGKINALLDWEFAHFGDPAEDIGYCWQFIEKYVEWDEFMTMYARHGGTPISYRQASFFRVWGDIRNAVMGVGALGTIDLSDEADIRSPSSALAFGPLLELQALRGAAEWNREFGKQVVKSEQAA